nr:MULTISPECIES: D-alanyl-D-alanine carboxypeptidase family protein [unclassified Sphingomonas]
MRRGPAVVLAGAALLLGTAAAARTAPALSPPATARAVQPVSAILVDARDGNVLYAQGANLVRRPASLTKMMTLFLAFDALDSGKLSLGDRVPISRRAASQQPSKLGLRPGSSITVDQAIRAIAVNSANDVAVALAEKLGGSEAAFAAQMTAKAHKLGMHETAFTNVTGLPGANVTTATEMAKLAMALLNQHPRRYAYFSTRTFDWGPRRLQNHNHLLGKFDGLDGIKTGYTVEAGFNLAASAKRGRRRLIAVVLGEKSVAARDQRVAQMLDEGFASLDTQSAVGAP